MAIRTVKRFHLTKQEISMGIHFNVENRIYLKINSEKKSLNLDWIQFLHSTLYYIMFRHINFLLGRQRLDLNFLVCALSFIAQHLWQKVLSVLLCNKHVILVKIFYGFEKNPFKQF